MNLQVTAVFLLVGLFSGIHGCSKSCSCPSVYQSVKTAVAVFYSGTSVSLNVSGTLTFTDIGSEGTSIVGVLTGLPTGDHGFHIHTYGNLTACTAGGGHYNPFGQEHGGPTAAVRHVGDLGNIAGGATTTINIKDTLIKLNGPQSVVGRMMVIHANRDDLGLGGAPDSKTTGNAGARIACAIIGIGS